MAELKDIIGYLCKNYPLQNELSKARLTKLVYLSDWKSVLEQGHQLSNIKWFFNHFGPYVEEVSQLAYEDEDFNVIGTFNYYGSMKEIISIKKPFEFNSLNIKDIEILDHVIENTNSLNWDDFIQLVYSTYPILINSKYSELDLSYAAKRYKDECFVTN